MFKKFAMHNSVPSAENLFLWGVFVLFLAKDVDSRSATVEGLKAGGMFPDEEAARRLIGYLHKRENMLLSRQRRSDEEGGENARTHDHDGHGHGDQHSHSSSLFSLLFGSARDMEEIERTGCIFSSSNCGESDHCHPLFGHCVPRRPPGAPCEFGFECLSGVCRFGAPDSSYAACPILNGLGECKEVVTVEAGDNPDEGGNQDQ